MISSFRAQCAARVVREGGVIAYPTEAVWGLGCDPWNEDAVYRLLALKARPVEKGLIVVAAHIQLLDFLLEDLPDVWLERLAGTWPGPNTWLVPHQDRLPEWVTGVHDSVAVRVTDHPLVQEPVLPHRATDLHLGQSGWAPRGAHPVAGRAVFPRRTGLRPRRRPRRTAQPQPDPRPGDRAGHPPGLRPPSQGSRTVEPVVRRAASSVCAWAASARAKRWLISMRMAPRSTSPNSSSAIAWSFSGVFA